MRGQGSEFRIQETSGFAAIDEFIERGEAAQAPLTPES
jgi:hypothetical protein